jgi:hypothetical protein
MVYTVLEASSKLKISKQSMYAKLKLTQYKDKVMMKQGQTVITDELFKLIENDMILNNKFTNIDTDKTTTEQAEQPNKLGDVMLDEDTVKLNQELVSALLEQLKEKDKQLENYSERMKQLIDLNKNSQILLREKPKQDILLLEEHFQDLDTKLEEVKENMQQRKEEQQQHKSIFSKMFKK